MYHSLFHKETYIISLSSKKERRFIIFAYTEALSTLKSTTVQRAITK